MARSLACWRVVLFTIPRLLCAFFSDGVPFAGMRGGRRRVDRVLCTIVAREYHA